MPDKCDNCGAEKDVDHFFFEHGMMTALCCACYRNSERYEPGNCHQDGPCKSG